MNPEFQNEDVSEGMRELRRMCPNCWYCWSPVKSKGAMYCNSCERLRNSLLAIHTKETFIPPKPVKTVLRSKSYRFGRFPHNTIPWDNF